MTLNASALARVHIALREGREIEVRYENAVIRTAHAAPVWGVPMVLRTVIDRGAWVESQWHETAEDMLGRLEEL